MSYTIKLDGGKYTVINEQAAGLTFLRHGEAWPAAYDLKHSGVVMAMAHRIEELETAIKAVLDGTLMRSGVRMDDGMVKGHADPAFTSLWEKNLRNVLEQKP